MGSIDTAIEMIRVAAECGADVVKFQKRNPKESVSSDLYTKPHPVPGNSFGKTYGEHREFLELSIGDHERLMRECESSGVDYSTSVWDVTSARDIVKLNPKYIKVPSACNTNDKLLRSIVDSFDGEVHVSLGMTTFDEIDKIEVVLSDVLSENLVYYHCTSGYPVPNNKLYLNEISELRYRFPAHPIGFSGHHVGTAPDVAAYVLGAGWIERHFTLDRTLKGTDHAASLDPSGLRTLCKDLNDVHEAMRYKPSVMDEIEVQQRMKLKYFEFREFLQNS
jgi:N-acetylneuraminate synthase